MKRKIGYLLGGMALLLLVSACDSDKQQASSSPTAPAGQAAPAASGQPAAGTIISGKVLETMDASGYTYLHLDQGDKQTWVAIPQSNVAVGDEVNAVFSMKMADFESKTLGRTFDEVIFSSGLAQEGTAPAPAGDAGSASFSEAIQSTGGDATAASGGSKAAMVPFNELKVEKANGDNAYTVGELFAKRADLNGKTVTLRGKVVKVSRNIMGKNWIHLQDGTGNPAEKTHDFVVTTDSEPEKDKIITISGLLAADKDFGAGYVYSAIVEDATVQVQE